MATSRVRLPLLCAFPLLLAVALAGNRSRSYRQGLPLGLLDWVTARSGRELEAPAPVERFEPPLRPAAGRLTATAHHGPLHPARAALQVGDETWIATPAGVLRFGPELWSSSARARPRGRCDVSSGLPSPSVNHLRLAGEDVEIATDAGLAVVDRRCRLRAAPSLQDRRVTALGPSLIGTWSGLLGGQPASPSPLLAAAQITAIQGCAGGPSEFTPLGGTAVKAVPGRSTAFVATHDRGLLLWHSKRPLPVPGLEAGRVAALTACRGTADGPTIFAAATAGLFEVRAGKAALVAGSPLHVTAVLELGQDLLVASFDDGLTLLRAGSRRAVPVPGRAGLLHRGPGSAVLVGSDRGLFVWRPGQTPVRVPLDGPPPGPITALAQVDDTIWAGTFDAGLARLDGDRWERVPVFDPRITSLHADAAGRLWVGTASGLGRVQQHGVVRVPDSRGWLRRHVASLRGSAGASDPTLWVAVYPGLVALDTSLDPPELEYLGARGQEADAGLPGPTIYAVAPGPDGLWVGSDDGLGRLSRSGVRLLSDLGGVLPDNWVNDLRGDGETLVALTLRSGLLRLSPAGSQVFATRVMTSPGVLLLVEGRILFGSNASGLLVLDEQSSTPPSLRSHGPAQGLPSAMVTSLLHDAARDRLWVGGSAGLTRIDRAARSLGLQAPNGKETAP